MKKIIKVTLLILTILLLASCGNKNAEVATAEEVKEVVSSRSIVISEINGNVMVSHNGGQQLLAYEGMNLYDGDDVVVDKRSNLTLSVDSDKHIFADENSHFWLTATGSEGNTKTVIHLNEGSVLCDIKEKLKDEETFDIQTASSTMCVRGTVFRVCLLKGNDNSLFDLVEVYDGKVWSNIENSEDNLTLEPGQCALIRKTDSTEETAATFVLAEDIDDKFVKETGLNISLDQAEGADKGAMKISLENVPVDTLSRLETIIEEGTQLVVEKEEIQEVKEIIETKKEEPKPEVKKVEVKVEEKKEEVKVEEKKEEKACEHNESVEWTTVPATCTSPEIRIMHCLVCGVTSQTTVGDKDFSNHVGERKEGRDEPTCKDRFRSYYEYCGACGNPIDGTEKWNEPDPNSHQDSNFDTVCDICGAKMGSDDKGTGTGDVPSSSN